jgi:hypothetical protein
MDNSIPTGMICYHGPTGLIGVALGHPPLRGRLGGGTDPHTRYFRPLGDYDQFYTPGDVDIQIVSWADLCPLGELLDDWAHLRGSTRSPREQVVHDG